MEWKQGEKRRKLTSRDAFGFARHLKIETDAKKSELVFQAVKGIKNNFRAF